MKKRWILSRQASAAFLVVLLLVVVGFSLYPRPEEVLGPLTAYDKAEHSVAYLVLAFFAMRVSVRRSVLALAVVISACAALGGGIEIIQPYFGRHKDIFDFLFDFGGSAVGAAFSFLLLRAGPIAR